MQNGAKFPGIPAGIFLKTYSREFPNGIPGGLGIKRQIKERTRRRITVKPKSTDDYVRRTNKNSK